ncbi:MAG: ParA family protein, partial [Candidatus Thiodiazotropha sp.]
RPLSKTYDYVFLDCPPSISLVSENIFRAAEGLLLPLIPTTLSMRTYDQLLDFLQGHRITGLKLMPFFSMVDRRKRMHLDIMENFPDAQGELLKAQIPYASDVERMGIHRMPVQAFSPNCFAASAYQALWMDVQTRLG